MTVHMAQYQLNKDETAYEFETLVDSKNSPYAYNRQPARSQKIVIDFDKVAEAEVLKLTITNTIADFECVIGRV